MVIDSLWLSDIGKIDVRSSEISDEPEYDEVQIEIKACGICTGDIAMWTGVTKKKIPMPYQFGHEAVGIVIKAGRGVKLLKPGNKVIVAGGGSLMSQVANVRENICGRIPDTVTDYELWIGEPVVCVVSALANCPVEIGDFVVLIGTGYMGLLNTMGYLGCLISRLICFDINDERLSIARSYGASEVYNLSSPEAEKVIDEIKRNGGADLICECTGVEAALNLSYSLMKTSGKLNQFAWHRRVCSYDATQQHLGGWKVYNTSPFIDSHIEDRIAQTAKLMSIGKFCQKRLITHVVQYKEAQDLMKIAANKNDGYIKGVINF